MIILTPQSLKMHNQWACLILYLSFMWYLGLFHYTVLSCKLSSFCFRDPPHHLLIHSFDKIIIWCFCWKEQVLILILWWYNPCTSLVLLALPFCLNLLPSSVQLLFSVRSPYQFCFPCPNHFFYTLSPTLFLPLNCFVLIFLLSWYCLIPLFHVAPSFLSFFFLNCTNYLFQTDEGKTKWCDLHTGLLQSF